MVALPLFKLGALFVRHISKYGANTIKVRAHEHPGFRHLAARYGQAIHQLNMRLSVALLRNKDAEKRALDRAQAAAEAAAAPTVKTKEQTEREAQQRRKEEADRAKHGTTARDAHPPTVPTSFLGMSPWRRTFRPLPETKAVDLFADVVGDAFILVIASALVLYEYYRSSGPKPDPYGPAIDALTAQLAALQQATQQNGDRLAAVETALRAYRDPETKQPLLSPTLQPDPTPATPVLAPSSATTPPPSPPAKAGS